MNRSQAASSSFILARKNLAMGEYWSQNARGKSVLFVECSHVLSSEIYRSLEALGALIVGPVSTIDEARIILGSMRIDGVVLDKDLEDVTNIEQFLADEDVPSIYSCNLHECVSGTSGCYRLHDAEGDPVALLTALFGSGPNKDNTSRLSAPKYEGNIRALNIEA